MRIVLYFDINVNISNVTLYCVKYSNVFKISYSRHFVAFNSGKEFLF